MLNQCLGNLDKWQTETFIRDSIVLEPKQKIFAALELKEETLAARRTAIIDHQNYSGQWMYAYPQFNILGNEPEI